MTVMSARNQNKRRNIAKEAYKKQKQLILFVVKANSNNTYSLKKSNF
jgi:hypothetical protein